MLLRLLRRLLRLLATLLRVRQAHFLARLLSHSNDITLGNFNKIPLVEIHVNAMVTEPLFNSSNKTVKPLTERTAFVCTGSFFDQIRHALFCCIHRDRSIHRVDFTGIEKAFLHTDGSFITLRIAIVDHITSQLHLTFKLQRILAITGVNTQFVQEDRLSRLIRQSVCNEICLTRARIVQALNVTVVRSLNRELAFGFGTDQLLNIFRQAFDSLNNINFTRLRQGLKGFANVLISLKRCRYITDRDASRFLRLVLRVKLKDLNRCIIKDNCTGTVTSAVITNALNAVLVKQQRSSLRGIEVIAILLVVLSTDGPVNVEAIQI